MSTKRDRQHHTKRSSNKAPQPQPAPNPDSLPQPLTFFLTVGERRAVLAKLRRRHRDRTTALKKALRIESAASSDAEKQR